MGSALRRLYDRIETYPGRWPEIVAFILFLLLTTFVAVFHEPWFDEAQAWLIARSASLWDLLFVIPKYEGHPPLWHLILLPLARSGIPFEVGIKSVALLISALSVGMILFRSPFPRIVRLILPFTFFYFYQYTVISRPYGLLGLGLLLAASQYRNRNTYPIRFVLSLALVCATSAYGIVLSAGIALAWFIELARQESLRTMLQGHLKDRRAVGLAGLLAWAILLCVVILPQDNTYAVSLSTTNGIGTRFAYMFLVAPADALFYQCFSEFGSLWNTPLPWETLMPGLFIGAMVLLFLIVMAYLYRKLALLLIPYALLSIFCATVYFFIHHIGIHLQFLVFWFWICLGDERNEYRSLPASLESIGPKGTEWAKLRSTFVLLIGFSLAASSYWSVVSSALEVKHSYGYGREMAGFIQQYGLPEYRIMSDWKRPNRSSDMDDMTNTNMVYGVDILPYFTRNILMNLNRGEDRYPYLVHWVPQSAPEEEYRIWREEGIPDILISFPDLDSVFKGQVSLDDYVPVYAIKSGFIWKTDIRPGRVYIQIRKDLMDRFPELSEIPVEFDFN